MQISHQRQREILAEVAPIAEYSSNFAEALQQAGFAAFRVWRAYEESFCACDRERIDHRQQEIEWAKARLAAPDGIPPLRASGVSREREEGGEPRVIALENDPCIRNRLLLEWKNPSVVENARNEAFRSLVEHREAEAARYGIRGKASAEMLTEYEPALISAFESFGFKRSNIESRRDFPVVARSLTPDWDLCWSAERSRIFRQVLRSGQPRERWLNLGLRFYVRWKKGQGEVKTPIGFQSLDFVMIRIGAMVPGFEWAYTFLGDTRHLWSCIAAHACLYQAVEPHLLPVLERQFDNLASNP